MPSWPTSSSSSSSSLPYIGVKLVTTHPDNNLINLPGVHATYVLFSSVTGQNLASMDGTEMTLRRTACVSALASSYLSNENSKKMIMVGAGALGPHLVRAHLTTRPGIRNVMIWNRNLGKAKNLVEEMGSEGMEGVRFEVCEDLEMGVRGADVVTCATCSEKALVLGEWLKDGAHLDLVGSYKPSMRECDDEAIRRGRVFVDNEVAKVEAGELVGAFERGVIKEDGVEGDLVELIKGVKSGRKEDSEITVFVSVGSAVVDLLSAQLAYETITVKPQT